MAQVELREPPLENGPGKGARCSCACRCCLGQELVDVGGDGLVEIELLRR